MLVDAGLRSQRVLLLDAVPESRDAYDLAAHVESRHSLREAGRLIESMSASDQGALMTALDESEAPNDRKRAGALAVQRHRARARLRQALAARLGWLGVRRGRWLWRLSSPSAEGWSASMVVHVMAAAATAGWLAAPAAASGGAAGASAVPAAVAGAARSPAGATAALATWSDPARRRRAPLS